MSSLLYFSGESRDIGNSSWNIYSLKPPSVSDNAWYILTWLNRNENELAPASLIWINLSICIIFNTKPQRCKECWGWICPGILYATCAAPHSDVITRLPKKTAATWHVCPIKQMKTNLHEINFSDKHYTIKLQMWKVYPIAHGPNHLSLKSIVYVDCILPTLGRSKQ